MRTDWDVIVVGAGLAGLAAGATAAAGGARTLVLESARPGGRARCVAKGPYVFNMGPHAFYTGGPGLAVLRELGVRPDGVPAPFPTYRLLKDGRLHTVPSGPASIARTTVLGRADKVQFATLFGRLGLMKPERYASMSVEDWIADQNLRPGVAAVVRTIIRLATYAADTETVSAGAVIRQLQIGAKPGVLYLHGGWAQLIDGLAAKVEVRPGAEVSVLEAEGGSVGVPVDGEVLRAGHVVVAAGAPAAVASVLGGEPGWGDLGEPATGACLDLGLTRVPRPGYVLSVDGPIMGVTQSPPARQAPEGHAVVSAIRYGATEAGADRADLEEHVAHLGVQASDIAESRFLARMVVAGALPLAARGGLVGRPRVTDSGRPGVTIAGDWVGPEGMLADASLASGYAAARHALAGLGRAPALVA